MLVEKMKIRNIFGVGLSKNIKEVYRKLSKSFEKNDKVFYGYEDGNTAELKSKNIKSASKK